MREGASPQGCRRRIWIEREAVQQTAGPLVGGPGLRTVGGIADIDGNYPSKDATGERGAWFRDSEGNLLGIGQLVR